MRINLRTVNYLIMKPEDDTLAIEQDYRWVNSQRRKEIQKKSKEIFLNCEEQRLSGCYMIKAFVVHS